MGLAGWGETGLAWNRESCSQFELETMKDRDCFGSLSKNFSQF